MRDKLPQAARDALTIRMDRHGDRMLLLFESVLLLNYPLAATLATELSQEPKLGRPARAEKGTLSALLPAAFFDHQDRLVERAGRLAEAARAQEDEPLMRAFADVASSCVGCHAAYLNEEEGGSLQEWLHAPEQANDEHDEGSSDDRF